jgi:CBS domain-containing protein
MNLIQQVLDDARRRLAILAPEALISDAAVMLVDTTTPIAVICDKEGVAVGVVSRTDLIKVLARKSADAAVMNVGSVMTNPFFSCHVNQTLQGVWEGMNERSLRCAPVLDDSRRPQGVVHARDLARALLEEVTSEELMLRDYVLGIGYQ